MKAAAKKTETKRVTATKTAAKKPAAKKPATKKAPAARKPAASKTPEPKIVLQFGERSIDRATLLQNVENYLAYDKDMPAAEQTGVHQALLFGGVMSSLRMRRLCLERVQKRRIALRPCFGKPELSGDNAVGVALIGCERMVSHGSIT